MDIDRISGGNQALSRTNAPAYQRSEVPQPPTAAAPVAPNNGERVAAPEAAKNVKINEAELKRSIDAINRFLQPAHGDIEFSVDEDTQRTLIKIVDTKTQTVLRQIPSKEALAIAKELDRLQGLLVKDKA